MYKKQIAYWIEHFGADINEITVVVVDKTVRVS